MGRKEIVENAYKDASQRLGNIHSIRNYISEVIIPLMNRRRGKTTPLSRDEIVDRLFRIPPNKPGEVYEVMKGELVDKGLELTPTLASEVGDIIYYTLQPNCPEHVRDPSPFLNYLGISMELAMQLCIVKYFTRLNYGESKDFKEIENEVLSKFLLERGLSGRQPIIG